ncbi:predicted protein [Histoplasma capsulatum H143]|uniref:Uncharacterized protein n=1 Tax=Ajellomyces capsulatus (strain H143) TaxID=544712 RepID=C6HE11_AJECH|nr:predicted protein [Histoplasma capsulatum H143]
MAVSFAFPSSLQFDSEYQQTCLETSHLRDSRLFHLILPLKQVCNIEAPGALREALNASANKFAFTIGGKIDCISLGGLASAIQWNSRNGSGNTGGARMSSKKTTTDIDN